MLASYERKETCFQLLLFNIYALLHLSDYFEAHNSRLVRIWTQDTRCLPASESSTIQDVANFIGEHLLYPQIKLYSLQQACK